MTKEDKPDAWMPLYIGDWTADTQHLSCEQDGAYFRLVRHYWRMGPLIDDDAVLARLTGLERRAWAKARPTISAFFTVSEGRWTHKRVDAELIKWGARKEKAVERAKAKWGESSSAERGRSQRSQRMAEARKIATHTASEWEDLKRFCGPRCLRCKKAGELVRDHIRPIYQGGSDGIENIQPMCRKCNASKGPESQDFRPTGWRSALGMPAKLPAEMPASCLPDASSSSSSTVERASYAALSHSGSVTADERTGGSSPPRSDAVVVDFVEVRDELADAERLRNRELAKIAMTDLLHDLGGGPRRGLKRITKDATA